ncbi:MAG: rhomboid family intramembrane serine protease [Bacteroidota bacterium]|nr:rhomboid family intramembrane serine protease [Bacteroidota bacterium]
MRNIPPATKHLLIINCLLYLAVVLTGNQGQGGPLDVLMLYYPTSEHFHFWQYFTYMFMHGGFMHLFFNMYALWLFGSMVEQTLGTKRFLILYFVAGIGAALVHTGVEYYQYWREFGSYVKELAVLNPMASAEEIRQFAEETFVSGYPYGDIDQLLPPTVGASGAIYGVMMAFAMLHPRAEMQLIFPPVRLTAKWMVVVFGGIEILTGIFATGDGIAHFAHLGGMLFAFFLVLYWKKHLYDNYWN